MRRDDCTVCQSRAYVTADAAYAAGTSWARLRASRYRIRGSNPAPQGGTFAEQ